MKVFQCGSTVITKIGKVEGIITAVQIRFNRVAYEVSYFVNQEYKTVWLDELEFDIKKCKQETIGFIK